MRSIESYPHTRPAVGTFELVEVRINGGLPDDDPQPQPTLESQLTVEAKVRVAKDGLARLQGVDGDGLTLVLSARHARASTVRVLQKVILSSGRGMTNLRGVAKLAEIGGELDVIVACALTCARQSPLDDHGPREAGSLVWRERRRFSLTGVAPQFPASRVDFGSVGLPVSALWHLRSTCHDLRQSFVSAFELLINQEYPDKTLLETIYSTPELVQSRFKADMHRLVLTEVARMRDHEDALSEFPQDSVGFVAHRLASRIAERYLMGTDDEVFRQLKENPLGFESRIQDFHFEKPKGAK